MNNNYLPTRATQVKIKLEEDIYQTLYLLSPPRKKQQQPVVCGVYEKIKHIKKKSSEKKQQQYNDISRSLKNNVDLIATAITLRKKQIVKNMDTLFNKTHVLSGHVRKNAHKISTTPRKISKKIFADKIIPYCKKEKTDSTITKKEWHWDLDPLPKPDPLPNFPSTEYCTWTFNEDNRVLLANFHSSLQSSMDDIIICKEDEKFLLLMMERDDITLIVDGMIHGLDKKLWNWGYITGCVGNNYHYKVRKFERESTNTATTTTYKEVDGFIPIKLNDYVSYLEKRRNLLHLNKSLICNDLQVKEKNVESTHSVMKDIKNSSSDDRFYLSCHDSDDQQELSQNRSCISFPKNHIKNTKKQSTTNTDNNKSNLFQFTSPDGSSQKINVIDTVLYLIDYNMATMLPKLDEDFRNNFKFPGFLPGGKHCMLNSVNPTGRPFMGPNLYITPPLSFTHFHQDGYGTVDSIHVCLSGYNEVVIVRRMTEERKQHALYLLRGGDRYNMSSQRTYDGIYDLPHGDGCGDKPMWPDHKAIELCRKMNYCPSVFILKPGQFVHINKGCLHAFRKMASCDLTPDDCHFLSRRELIQANKLKGLEVLCMSVAWDLMYKGFTAQGINSELTSCLTSARINQKNFKMSLAIPETCLLHMAQTFVSKYEQETSSISININHNDLLALDTATKFSMREEPSSLEVLKGILPSLRFIVKKHKKLVENTIELSNFNERKKEKVTLCEKPNTWENPDTCSLDPYGCDFFCKICHQELSNVYMHCDGCEEILRKDFNICSDCHIKGYFRTFVQMHPLRNDRHSTINHVGNFHYDRESRCPCKKGPVCKKCNYCAGCSCRCHRWFTLYIRFMDIHIEEQLLRRVELAVGHFNLPYANETMSKLSAHDFGHSNQDIFSTEKKYEDIV